MTFRAFRIAVSTFALASGLVAVAALLLFLSVLTTPAQAESPARPRSAPHLQNGSPLTRYVAITGTDAYTCATPISACRTLQYAVDVADAGDVIKIASGVYTGINHHGGLAQVVYVSKTLTIQGGYTTTNWITPDFAANLAIVDAEGQGRGLYIIGDISVTISVTIEGLLVTNGDATGIGDWWSGENQGGGMYVITATIMANRILLADNTADDGGGAYLGNSVAEIRDSAIFSNTTDSTGGGLSVSENSAVTLTGNTVSHNTSNTRVSNQGGGLSLDRSKATLISNTFSSNRNNGGGGVCLNWGADAVLIGNTFISNTAIEGGGLYVSSADVVLSSNTFIANSAELGGGLWLIGSSHQVTVADNLITGNTASVVGGGVYVERSNAVLERNLIARNTADYGGGLALITNCDAALVNNVVSENQGTHEGSGIGIYDSRPRLSHNTVARNIGGSGIYVSGYWGSSDVVISNTILVSHTMGITVAAGDTVRMEATLWGDGIWANGRDWDGAGTILTGTHNYWGDPAFVNPGAGDYHIRASSAAVDKGLDAGVNEDIDGTPRPIGYGYDIGADESEVSLAVAKWVTPETVRPGTALTYTISITNAGIVTLTPAITDVLPSHVTPTGVLTWTPAALVPGGVWTKVVVVTAEMGYAGLLTNVVKVTTAEDATGTYTATSQVHGTPSLAVTTQTAPDPVAAGARLTYTIRVTNTGDVHLHATVTDTLPAHVAPGGVLTWTPTISAPGGAWVKAVVVTVEMGYVGPLTNVVKVTTAEGAMGAYTATSQVRGTPSLAVTTQAAPGPVAAGARLTYTIRVTNTGDVHLHATVTDTLPAHVAPSGVLTWTPTIPAPGGVWVKAVVVTVEMGYTGPLTNVVDVRTQEGATGRAEASTTVICCRIYLPVVLRQYSHA